MKWFNGFILYSNTAWENTVETIASDRFSSNSFVCFQFGLVVKTSLKLLIIFGEYAESNALLLLTAVSQVDRSAKRLPWTNAMRILCDTKDTSSEIALLIITLFNTVLSALSDQDTFFDMTDALEQQGMQRCTQFYLNKVPAEAELIEQFQIYDVSERWTGESASSHGDSSLCS